MHFYSIHVIAEYNLSTDKSELADTTYAHNLVIKSTHEYKVHGLYGSNFLYTIWPRRGPVGLMVHGKLEPYGPWTLYS